MRNIALVLMYNGTAYHGWQVQKTEVSVAQTLEKGLSMVCGHPVKVIGWGPPRRRRPRGALCGQFPYRVADTGGSPALCGEYPYPGGYCGKGGL